MRKINEIIVHCTATFPEQVVTVADVTRWHQKLGWKTIGYHYLVTLAGEIQAGRPIEEAGAHCKGHNANSIGVCYVGGLDTEGRPTDTRTPDQRQALETLLKQLRTQFPNAKIHGHRDFAKKACPCFDATTEYTQL